MFIHEKICSFHNDRNADLHSDHSTAGEGLMKSNLLNKLFGRGKKSEAIEITTNKSVYNSTERVAIYVKNSGNKGLEGTPACIIYDGSDTDVYSFKFAQVARKLRSGESMPITWKQIGNEGEQVGDGVYKVECSFADLNESATFEIKSRFAKIGAMIANPKNYRDKEVTIRGKFIGWSIPEHEIKTSMTTRNDWLVEDNTGAIYVTQLNPDPLIPWESGDIGKQIIVIGRIMTIEKEPCIEGKSLQVIK